MLKNLIRRTWQSKGRKIKTQKGLKPETENLSFQRLRGNKVTIPKESVVTLVY